MAVKKIVFSAILAAVYFAVTMLLAPISFGPIQCRISEALTIFPFFIPSSMWGLFVGCLLSNFFGGVHILDIVFGSLATLLAGYITSKIKKPFLVPLPSIIINAIVVGAIITVTSVPADSFLTVFPITMLQVGIGQIGSCALIGLPVLYLIPKISAIKSFITIN